MRSFNKIIAVLLVMVMTLSILPVSAFTASAATTSDSAPSVSAVIKRLGGADRYETSTKIAQEGWTSADTVVLASADSYADALAGAPLARAKDAPIMLVSGKSVNAKVMAQIKALGANNVYLLGGTAAISAEIEAELTKAGYTVIRLWDSTRYGTAVAVAKELVKISGNPAEVFIASGVNYPDALSASSIAGIKGVPILYAPANGVLDDATIAFIKSAALGKAYILGGTAAIDNAVVGKLTEAGVASTERLGGNDRYDTSLIITKKFDSVFTSKDISIATGKNYPDALAGGAFSAKKGIPVLLTDNASVNSNLKAYIAGKAPAVAYVFGGESVVSDAIVKAYLPIPAPTTTTTESTTTATTAAPSTPATPAPVPSITRYKVTFEANGDNVENMPAEQKVKKNQCATEPADPTREGFTFEGWYTEAECENEFDFATKITKKITLYAKWLEDTAMDDANDKEDTTVGEDDQFILSADTKEVLADSDTRVTFYVNSTLTIPCFELYIDGENTGIKLYDDGDYSAHNDDIPNDGCYTGTYSIDISEEKDVIFIAKAVVGETEIATNEVSIFVYSKLADDEIETLLQISDDIHSSMAKVENEISPNATEDEKIEAKLNAILDYLSELENQNIIENIKYNSESKTVSYRMKDTGIIRSVLLKSFESNSSMDSAAVSGVSGRLDSVESNQVSLAKLSKSNDYSYITYKEKAAVLCYDSNSNSDLAQSVNNTSDKLTDAGFEVSEFYSITVDDFRELHDYAYIYINAHGSLIEDGVNQVPVICTSQIVTPDNLSAYSTDLFEGRIAIVDYDGNDTCYLIMPQFFTDYYSDNKLKSNIVSLGCCRGYFNDKLVAAIRDAGAEAVTAYSEIVYTWYDYHMQDVILDNLLNGKTIVEAVAAAKTSNGDTDLIWGAAQRDSGNHNFDTLKAETAIMNVSGNAIIHSSLKNGLFDVLGNGLESWKTYGDARAVVKLSGILAKSFPKMAIISSGFGSLNDETTSFIYQTILVPENASMLAFAYDVISEEPMEWVHKGYNDNFVAELLNTDGEVLETMAYEDVDTSTWFAVDGIDFPGGDSTTYHTRWVEKDFDVSEYQGKLVVIRFKVEDAGDAIYDTAALIDSVRFIAA